MAERGKKKKTENVEDKLRDMGDRKRRSNMHVIGQS